MRIERATRSGLAVTPIGLTSMLGPVVGSRVYELTTVYCSPIRRAMGSSFLSFPGGAPDPPALAPISLGSAARRGGRSCPPRPPRDHRRGDSPQRISPVNRGNRLR